MEREVAERQASISAKAFEAATGRAFGVSAETGTDIKRCIKTES